ncbi:MAG: pantetheine-phosphate adenylyltransferase [Candidatus Bipolaricaulota bacterium]|nr:pantetheine-phosphate adenylyltransferase [Candidatus Bipolaricaulota bacterium]MCS7274493.1 pantetheine-phosphate adenylyltransferase [Candidatus Bipolaricaulota bacterium]MDW8111110.1 pantetheine-phosphate adenylyltransferase [Candidatus Bipolaricaulota bacterium]MDW8329060.1 pantetheine-phosphate adenylyltransferase [Candidatus Bipolaricaulota bacterium]
MTKALYPGSFDPITYGHIDIIKRAQKLFDRLIVAVMRNPDKPMLFTLEERHRLVVEALREVGLNTVEIITHDGLLVDLARHLRVDAVVRGLRASTDFEYEFQLALTNRDLYPDFESVYLMTSRDFSFISSSIVRQVKSYGGDVSRFVPACVDRALTEKLRR